MYPVHPIFAAMYFAAKYSVSVCLLYSTFFFLLIFHVMMKFVKFYLFFFCEDFEATTHHTAPLTMVLYSLVVTAIVEFWI